MTVRELIFLALPNRVKVDWAKRAMANDVGFAGHGKTALDRDVKPLGKFAHWLLLPEIAVFQKMRQESWREACMEVLGEDLDDWGGA